MQFIYLNNFYTWKELISIDTSEQWFIDIQSFLSNWFSDNKFINVNTSGSTGIPKTIKLPKNNIIHSADITINYFNLDASQTSALCLPAKYIAGKMMIVRALQSGMDLIIEEPSSSPLQLINKAIDFVALTPMQIENILDNNPDNLNLINKIIIGGGAVSPPLSDRLQDIKSLCYQTYGMTETITHIALQPINGTNKSDHLKVLDGFSIGMDDRGCLSISAEHIYEKHVITNDLVDIIDPKCFKWLGRYDNVINTGGVKVYPEVIESKIQSLIDHPYFIIGMDDDHFGQKVVLCIQADDQSSINQEHLLNQIKSRLSKFEIPRSIITFDCFLFTETGKIRRRATLESL